MKRILIGALDYGLAFGIDRVQRELLERKRLSAVGALVSTDLWAREFRPLQDTMQKVGSDALFGVTLAFSGDRVSPVSSRMQDAYGDQVFTRNQLHRLALFRLLPDEIVLEEALAQLARYSVLMNRAPDFVAVRDEGLARKAISRLVFKAIIRADFDKQPRILLPYGMGKGFDRMRRFSKKYGLEVINEAAPLPETDDRKELQKLLYNHFDGMADSSFVTAIPGQSDERLLRDETRKSIRIRECHHQVLESPQFARTLLEKDIFLH